MTFKDELLELKRDLQQKKNYRTRYISEQIRDDYDLERELGKRNWQESQEWPLCNTREAIENQKGKSKKRTIETLRTGIKSYIAMLLEDDIDFDSIDLVLDINLLLEESAFKSQKPATERTMDDYLADTINLTNIGFSAEGAIPLITKGQTDIVVSYTELLTVLDGLGFQVEEKPFEQLVEERKESKYQKLRFGIPLTNEKENENQNGDDPKGPSQK